jgi:hypothetical protein
MAIWLDILIIDILSYENGIIFALFQTRIDLQGRDFNNPLPVQFYHALVRPSYLIVIIRRNFQAPHFDLILITLLSAEILIGF